MWSFMIGTSYCGSEVYSFNGHIGLWHWKEGTEHRIVAEGGWYSFLFVWWCLTPLSTTFQLYRGWWFRLWLVGRLFESYPKLWVGEYGLLWAVYCIVAWGMWTVLIGVLYCVLENVDRFDWCSVLCIQGVLLWTVHLVVTRRLSMVMQAVFWLE